MAYPVATDVTLMIAITLGVALPIILAVIIVVVCLRMEHNKRKHEKPQRPPSAIELDGGGESVDNCIFFLNCTELLLSRDSGLWFTNALMYYRDGRFH